MEITIRVEVQYHAPEPTVVRDVLTMFRTPTWVRFLMRYISPRLKSTSPADKSVLANLKTEWKISDQDVPECVICMHDSPACEYAQLPCDHVFHDKCIASWLEVNSTCPMCRFQFPKALKGTYAVHKLHSTLVLAEPIAQLPRTEIPSASVGNTVIRAMANVTLIQVVPEQKEQEYPCELSAWMLDSNGVTFSESNVLNSTADCNESCPATAATNETNLPDGAIVNRRKRSSIAAQEECEDNEVRTSRARTC